AQFIVFQPARDEHRVALLAAQELAALEFELDPAVQQVDELAVAGVIMPAGRLRHAGLRLHDLAAHLAAAGFLQGEVAVAEKLAPSLAQDRLLGAGIAELRCRLGDRRDVVGHRNLLLSWSRSMRCRIVEEAQPPGKATRDGSQANRVAANGPMSIDAGRPESRSATILPVIGAAVMPTWPCPKA